MMVLVVSGREGFRVLYLDAGGNFVSWLSNSNWPYKASHGLLWDLIGASSWT